MCGGAGAAFVFNNYNSCEVYIEHHCPSPSDKPYDTKLEASVPDNIGVINSSIGLTCTAHANPPVTAYNIYHSGILVSNSSSGTYNVTRALVEHSGFYMCIPYNDLGRGEKASLNVSFVGKL